MLFGDESRFKNKLVPSSIDTQVMGVTSTQTDNHVGPGAYYNPDQSSLRRKSFSRREPMTPGRENFTKGRSDYYTSGVLTNYGALSTPSKDVVESPGPGAYSTNLYSSFSKSSSFRSPRKDVSTSNPHSPTNMATSPRFSFANSTVLKNGVLFQSAANEKNELGPGYYTPNKDSFLKHSFNVRAQGNRPGSASKNTNTTTTRPRSASSGRLRGHY